MKERGARAARQAAEKSSSVTAAAAAAVKGESGGGGGDCLGKRALPTVSSKNRSAGTPAALSATVLG